MRVTDDRAASGASKPAPCVALPQPLVRGFFLARPNRFIVEAHVEGKGPVVAHLADPGRLQELLRPGVELRLHPHDGSRPRRTAWSVVLARRPKGVGWVSLNTTVPNRLIGSALLAGALQEFDGCRLLRREIMAGDSRFDFLLRRGRSTDLYLEVKSVSLVESGIALFPDAVTARGARHLERLSELASGRGIEGAVLFVVQRSDADRVMAARSIDPVFADALEIARRKGVRVRARTCRVNERRVSLGPPIPVA